MVYQHTNKHSTLWFNTHITHRQNTTHTNPHLSFDARKKVNSEQALSTIPAPKYKQLLGKLQSTMA